eukprot:scaffold8936_cov61-Phaeocystis_antarctica.AAC.9
MRARRWRWARSQWRAWQAWRAWRRPAAAAAAGAGPDARRRAARAGPARGSCPRTIGGYSGWTCGWCERGGPRSCLPPEPRSPFGWCTLAGPPSSLAPLPGRTFGWGERGGPHSRRRQSAPLDSVQHLADEPERDRPPHSSRWSCPQRFPIPDSALYLADTLERAQPPHSRRWSCPRRLLVLLGRAGISTTRRRRRGPRNTNLFSTTGDKWRRCFSANSGGTKLLPYMSPPLLHNIACSLRGSIAARRRGAKAKLAYAHEWEQTFCRWHKPFG